VEVEVMIEIPQGSRNKYEMDHERGRIRLDRMLFTSARYPLELYQRYFFRTSCGAWPGNRCAVSLGGRPSI
jgi:hypothetical protein